MNKHDNTENTDGQVAASERPSKDDLFAQAENDNVDRIPPVTGVSLLNDGIDAIQDVESHIDASINGEEGLEIIYQLLDIAYHLYQWSIANPEEFTTICDRHKVKARKDANPAVIVFKLIGKLAGAVHSRSYYSKWARVVDLAYREGVSIESFTEFLRELGGWHPAYERFQIKYGNHEARERRQSKTIKNARKVATLEQDVPVSCELPVLANDNRPIGGETGGLGLLVYREGVEGEDGILGRVNLTVAQAQDIILKYGLLMDDDRVSEVVGAISPTQDNGKEMSDAV